MDLCTFFPAEPAINCIDAFLDSDWGGDDLDRKSVMGGVIMVGDCRIHSHSRGGATQALSSAEGEIMSASELLKEALGVQHVLEFDGRNQVFDKLTARRLLKQTIHHPKKLISRK